MTKNVVSSTNAYELRFDSQLDRGVFLCRHELPLVRGYEPFRKQHLIPYIAMRKTHLPSKERLMGDLPRYAEKAEDAPDDLLSHMMNSYFSQIEAISKDEVIRNLRDKGRLAEKIDEYYENCSFLHPGMESQVRIDIVGGVVKFPDEYARTLEEEGINLERNNRFFLDGDKQYGIRSLIVFPQFTQSYRNTLFRYDSSSLGRGIKVSRDLPERKMVPDYGKGAKKILEANHATPWQETSFMNADPLFWRGLISSVFGELRKPEGTKVTLFSQARNTKKS